MDKYYQDLLASETNSGNHVEQQSDSDAKGPTTDPICVPEKWKGQIEKVTACMLFQFCRGSFFHYFSSSIADSQIIGFNAGFASYISRSSCLG